MRRLGGYLPAFLLALGLHAGLLAGLGSALRTGEARQALPPPTEVALRFVAPEPEPEPTPRAAVQPVRPAPPPPPLPEPAPVEERPRPEPAPEAPRLAPPEPAAPPAPETPADPGERLGAAEPAVPASPREPPPEPPQLRAPIEPAYPRLARRRGQEGAVRLQARVGASGRVEEVEVLESSGHDALDGAAVQAVERARFQPARREGRAVEETVTLTVRFRLED